MIKKLRDLSREHDSDKNGVNILLLLNDGGAARKADAKKDNAGEGGDLLEEDGAAAGGDKKEEASEEGEIPSSQRVIDRLKVENQDLYTILQLVKKLSRLKLYIEPNAVIFADPSVPFEDYDLKVFIVEKQALENMLTSAGGGGAAAGDGGGDKGDAPRERTDSSFREYAHRSRRCKGAGKGASADCGLSKSASRGYDCYGRYERASR